MDNMPKITIVTVTYNLINDNRKEFFKQCCKSVAEQTYPNIEHLIIYGASNDGTLELIEECRHPRMRVISEPDNGMWEGMNKAIYLAEGDYIAYMNSDDFYYSNDIIEKCINKLSETGADYCVGAFRYRTHDMEKISDWNEYIPVCNNAIFYQHMTYNHETLICKTDVYKKYGGHNLKYKTCIDYYWNIQLILNDCIKCYTDDIVFVGRGGGATATDDGKCTNATIENVTNLWKDLWNWYPLTDEDCKKMLLYGLFPKDFLKQLKIKITDLHLQNFDYPEFYKSIDEKIKNFRINEILERKCGKFLVDLLSRYKQKRYKTKDERLINHLRKHKICFKIMSILFS